MYEVREKLKEKNVNMYEIKCIYASEKNNCFPKVISNTDIFRIEGDGGRVSRLSTFIWAYTTVSG